MTGVNVRYLMRANQERTTAQGQPSVSATEPTSQSSLHTRGSTCGPGLPERSPTSGSEREQPRTRGGASHEERPQRTSQGSGNETRRRGAETPDASLRTAGASAAPVQEPATRTSSLAPTTVINNNTNNTYFGDVRDSSVAFGNQGEVKQFGNEIRETAQQYGGDVRRTAQAFRESLQPNPHPGLADPAAASRPAPTSTTRESAAQRVMFVCERVKAVLEGMRADLPAMRLGHAAEQAIMHWADELDAHLAGPRPDLVRVRAGLDEIATVLGRVRRTDDSSAGEKTADVLTRIRAVRAQLDLPAVA